MSVYIDLSLGTTGHAGTIGDPWSYYDYRSARTITPNGTLMYVKGSIHITTNISGQTLGNWFIWDKWPGEDPWRLNWDYLHVGKGSGDPVFTGLIMKNGIFYSDHARLTIGIQAGADPGVAGQSFSNMLINSFDLLRIYLARDVSFKGCSIKSADQTTIQGAFGYDVEYPWYDCTFDSPSFVFVDTDSSKFTTNNFAFTVGSLPGVHDDVQYSWAGSTWPAWDADSSAFSSAILTAGVTTPPQPGTPPYTGYETDMWGNTRTGIGGGEEAAGDPPTIDTQPVSDTVVAGDDATFTIVASGTEPLTYQWYKFDGTWQPVVGATSSTFIITDTEASDAGTYRCTVTNDIDSVDSDSVTLTVNFPPTIDTQPVSDTVVAGDDAIFTIAASGTVPLTYQWYKFDGTWQQIVGETSTTFEITDTEASDAGTYKCTVTNIVDSIDSNSVTLTVNFPPTIDTQPQSEIVVEGDDATFTIAASGTAPLTYQWYKLVESAWESVVGETSTTFEITDAEADDAGTYKCTVTNIVDSVDSNSVTLTVNLPPSITTQPESTSVSAGETATFTVVASGTGTLLYQWYKLTPDAWELIVGATSATLTITDAQASDIGSYKCGITNDYGAIETNTVSLTVTDAVSLSTIAVPRGGYYRSAQSVRLVTNEPATTRFTTDGSTPDSASEIYSAPIEISQDTTLKFYSVDQFGNVEDVHVEKYQIHSTVPDTTAPVITASPAGGTYQNLKYVTLTSNEPATIYYSTDGRDPSVNNTLGNTSHDTTPVTIEFVTNSVHEIRYFGVDPSGNTSVIGSSTYVIDSDENNLVPTNVFVSYPYIKNTLDVSWDDMVPIDGDVVGYNVYRSPTELGDFARLNTELVQTTFYRDLTLDKRVISEDVSSQFQTTTTPTTTDFEGQVVCDCQWEAIDPHQLFNQSDGIYFTDVYGNRRNSTFQSKFRLSGDFDIESIFEIIDFPITEVNLVEKTSFSVAFNEFTYIEVSRERRNATDYYVSRLVVDSTEVSKQEVVTADVDGTIRFVRVGPDVSTYYYDGSNFILLDSYLSFSSDDLQVKYFAESADKPINVKWHNFQINSGGIYSILNDLNGQVCIQTQHKPITSTTLTGQWSDKTSGVEVDVDGEAAIVKKVDGINGLIFLETERQFDDILGKWIEPVIPNDQSVVTVTYQYNINMVKLQLRNAYFYKVTAVLNDGTETRLSLCPPEIVKAEKIDWMYTEAVRRNNWLLDQTGERVLLFIRKVTGEKCRCYEKNERTHAQPKVGDCKICWGTGFVGGYEGPFEIRIAPLQTEQKIALTDRGMKLDNTQDTWTTISPKISQRDFIVRRENMIYGVGPVSAPEIKGLRVQQHFQIGHFDTTDIRYEFIESLNLFNYQTRKGLRGPFTHYSEDQGIVEGEITEKDRHRTNKSPGFDNEKGRTLTFENTTF